MSLCVGAILFQTTGQQTTNSVCQAWFFCDEEWHIWSATNANDAEYLCTVRGMGIGINAMTMAVAFS